MGAALSNAIKSIDGSSDAEKETRDALNSLFELGKSRNDAAFAHATSDAMKVYAPVQKVLLQRQSIIASASNNTDGIVDGIKKAVGNLMRGQILDGVTDIIGNALNVVLGSSSGQISQSYTYALVATDLGALLRIDVDVYSFEIYSQGLQSHAKNMTAITSIISTVNPNGLNLSDIRGVVSMSYGHSPIETQQNIFNLVKSAWENDRKVAVGQSLSSVDQENALSLFVPSKYEQQMDNRRSQGLLTGITPSPPKKLIGRAELSEAMQARKAASKKISGSTLASLEDDKDKANPKLLWVDLAIWFQLVAPPSEQWQKHMEGALRGFEEDGSFQYGQITGGRSGSAICFQCQVSAEPTIFDLAVSYCNDTILPALRKAEYLSSNVSSMALQYSHPTKDNSGRITSIVFKQNLVTNSTEDIITFHSPEESKTLLSLQPREQKLLSGTVSYISSSSPVIPPSQPDGPIGKGEEGTGTPNGTPSKEPKGTSGKEGENAPPQPSKFAKAKDYVTYQDVKPQDILTTVPATILKLPSGGYQIEMRDPGDNIMQIRYNSVWPTSNV